MHSTSSDVLSKRVLRLAFVNARVGRGTVEYVERYETETRVRSVTVTVRQLLIVLCPLYPHRRVVYGMHLALEVEESTFLETLLWHDFVREARWLLNKCFVEHFKCIYSQVCI